MKPSVQRRALAAALALALAAGTPAAPVPNGFRIYGFVTRSGAPFNGTVDLQIQLFDAASGNGTIGPTVTIEDVPVVGGDLVTFVDFGAVNPFVDMETFLGGGVRLGTSTGAFNVFTGRARFSPTGFSLHAQKLAPATVGTQEIRSGEVQRRISTGCPDGEAVRTVTVDGSVVCTPVGGGGGGGDISGVLAGAGLTGGGDSGTVSLSVADFGITSAMVAGDAIDASKIPTGAIGADEIATDAVGSAEIAANAVTSAKIAPNTITQEDADTTSNVGLQRRIAGNCPPGQAIGSVAADGSIACNTASGGWTLSGNAGTNPALNFIGTTDGQFFDIRANGRRAMRFGSLDDPSGGAYGGAIATTTVAGGSGLNTASGVGATVGGGGNAEVANVAVGRYSTVPGGIANVAGGDYSFAAGRRATIRSPSQSGDADGDEGAFVFADSQDAALVTTGPDQFLVRARGGVGFNTVPGGSENLAVAGDAPGSDTLVRFGNGADASALSVAGSPATLGLYPGGTPAVLQATNSGFTVSTANEIYFQRESATGEIGIGLAASDPQSAVHLSGSRNGADTPANHVGQIENVSTGSSADVLALRVRTSGDPGTGVNFVSFFDGDFVSGAGGADQSLGSIQGNGAGGVVLAGPGNDYAEYLPKLNADEVIVPGDVIGVFGGKVSKRTQGADLVLVASTGAIVAGNDPGTSQRNSHALAAFIGQADIRVAGAAHSGDYLVPSGADDGRARAVSAAQLSLGDRERVIGRAWGDARRGHVRAVIGLDRAEAVLARSFDALQRQLQAQSREAGLQLAAMAARVNSLSDENVSLRAALESRLVRLESNHRTDLAGTIVGSHTTTEQISTGVGP